MAASVQPVTLRAAAPRDQDFLLAVFAGTRVDELAALGWDPKQREFFLNMQFNAQQQSYVDVYPAAVNNIILLAERPIGRMLVDRTANEITLVDIALLGEYRNRQIGTSLLRNLMDEAATAQKSVRLSVFKSNPALRLYQRLGFSQVGEDALYFEMQWLPGPDQA
jgi:ribosomal protein S18 acetylase RimI-like enzyme